MLEKLKRLQYGARIKLYSGDQMNVVEIGGRRTQYLRGGSGAPLLYLHTGIGETNWMPFHQALSRNFDVIAPAHPASLFQPLTRVSKESRTLPFTISTSSTI
jgi:hypothetical protein